MSFDMIGCKVNMDASYGSISDKRAFFDFHIKAETSTSRGLIMKWRCSGTCLLRQESVKGMFARLQSEREPRCRHESHLPVAGGWGVLTLKKIKVMGLKLFTSMSQTWVRKRSRVLISARWI